MAAFEFGFIFIIQTELFESLLALLVVPGVAEQHAADVPEKSADSWQSRSSEAAIGHEWISYKLREGGSSVHGDAVACVKAPILNRRTGAVGLQASFSRSQCAA